MLTGEDNVLTISILSRFEGWYHWWGCSSVIIPVQGACVAQVFGRCYNKEAVTIITKSGKLYKPTTGYHSSARSVISLSWAYYCITLAMVSSSIILYPCWGLMYARVLRHRPSAPRCTCRALDRRKYAGVTMGHAAESSNLRYGFDFYVNPVFRYINGIINVNNTLNFMRIYRKKLLRWIVCLSKL